MCQKSDTLYVQFFIIHLDSHAKLRASCGLKRITKSTCTSFSMYKFDEVKECLDGSIFRKYEFRLKVFYFYIDLLMNLAFLVMFYLRISHCLFCSLISKLVHTYPFPSFLWISNRLNTFFGFLAVRGKCLKMICIQNSYQCQSEDIMIFAMIWSHFSFVSPTNHAIWNCYVEFLPGFRGPKLLILIFEMEKSKRNLLLTASMVLNLNSIHQLQPCLFLIGSVRLVLIMY